MWIQTFSPFLVIQRTEFPNDDGSHGAAQLIYRFDPVTESVRQFMIELI